VQVVVGDVAYLFVLVCRQVAKIVISIVLPFLTALFSLHLGQLTPSLTLEYEAVFLFILVLLRQY